MMKILICGHRAYAAKGLCSELENKGYEVVCFSRGEQKKEGNVITGNVLEIDNNHYLINDKFDVIINFILLADASINDNIRYISALCNLADKTETKKLIHMSSISCYPNDSALISANTAIDSHPEFKGYYGALKINVDNYLLNRKSKFKVVMMRPGFITAPDKKNALSGIAKVLPGGFVILMGNKKSTLPLCERHDLHMAILDAIEAEEPNNVYLLVGNGNGTKYSYLKTVLPNSIVIPLSKVMVVGIAKILKSIWLFDERKYQMVKGQFKVQHFAGESK